MDIIDLAACSSTCSSPSAGEYGCATASSIPDEPCSSSSITDEEQGDVVFYMYHFKVLPCCNPEVHDCQDCPYAHPSEKATRRDPRVHRYTGVSCPSYRKGSCKDGDTCPYAHGVFEVWLHPSRFRTELCKDGTSCTRKCCFFAHTPEQLRTPTPQDSSLPALPQKADRQAAHSRNSSNSSNTVDASAALRTGSGTILSSGNGSSLPPLKCAVQRSASAGAAIIGAVSGATPAPVPMAAQHSSGLPMRPNSLSISKHAASANSSSGNLLLQAAAPELLRAMSCTPGAPAATAAVQGCGDMLGPQPVPLAFNASASAAPAPAGAFNAGLHALAWQSPASAAMATATTTAAAAPGSKMVRVPLDIALEAAMLAQSAGDSALPPLPTPLQHPMVGSSAGPLQGCSVWPELTGITAMHDAASAAMTSPPFGLNLNLSATAAAAQQLLAAQHQELLASMLVQQSLAVTEQQQQRQEQDRLQEMWFAAFNAAKGVGLGDAEAAACADCAVKQTAAAAPSAVCPVSSAAPGCSAAAAASMLGGVLPVNAQLLHQQPGQQQLQALQLTAALQQQQQHQEQQLLASLMLGNGMQQQQGQPLVEVPHCKQVEAFDVLGHLGGLTSAFAGLLQ